MSTTFVSPQYGVAREHLSFCRFCHEKIVWQTSYKNGKKYATDVKISNGEILPPGVHITSRNWFHKCTVVVLQQLPLLDQPPIIPAVYSPSGTSRAAKVRSMKEFLDKASEPQLRQALTAIFNRQTNTEQVHDVTSDLNKIGFGGSDAEICSNIHKAALKFGYLKGKQVDLIRKKMKKYSRQLVEALEGKEWSI